MPRRICAALTLTFVSLGSLAQDAGITLPGQIERQFRMLPAPRGSGELPATPTPLPSQSMPAQAESIRFRLRALDVVGAERLPAEQVEQQTVRYLDREISLADLYQLADQLSALYRAQGYLLSQVIVPAQQIEDGRATLQAVEGFVNQVAVEGGDVDQRDLVMRYAMKIRQQQPLTNAVLERYMLLINDLPGIFAYATLSPSAERFAAADLSIHLTRRRFDAGINVDNRGGRILGSERVIADLALANQFGRYDNTSLKVVASPGGELAYLALRHEQPVGSEGGKLSLGLSRTRAEPEERSFVPLNLETRSRSLELGYSHPLQRSRRENLFLRASLAAHDGEERVFGIKDREDRVRSLRLGLTWDFVDPTGGTSIFDLEGSIGLDALGASDNDDRLLTREGGRVDYRKMAFFAAHLRDIAPHWSLLVALNGQYAFDSLLSSELYAFGGESFGRGYDPSELVGDHGAAAKFELRYADHLAFGSPLPVQAYGFYDFGQIWSRSDDQADASAASTGIGARLIFSDQINGFIELAKPLTREVSAEGNDDARIYAGFSARL